MISKQELYTESTLHPLTTSPARASQACKEASVAPTLRSEIFINATNATAGISRRRQLHWIQKELILVVE
jgi:hypothetical protein